MVKNAIPKRIEVIAYSGYKANERPLYLILDEDARLEVKAIVRRWREKDHDFFKVLAQDRKEYLISWCRDLDLWSLEKAF